MCLGGGIALAGWRTYYSGSTVTRKRPGDISHRRTCMYWWWEAKATKEIVGIPIPVLYLPTRGEKYKREKRRLLTALKSLYSSLYYMTYLWAVGRSSYVIDTGMFDMKREAKRRTKNTARNKKWPLSILSLAIYVVAHIIGWQETAKRRGCRSKLEAHTSSIQGRQFWKSCGAGRCEGRDAGVSASLGDSTGSSM